jgi:hypothetical protein
MRGTLKPSYLNDVMGLSYFPNRGEKRRKVVNDVVNAIKGVQMEYKSDHEKTVESLVDAGMECDLANKVSGVISRCTNSSDVEKVRSVAGVVSKKVDSVINNNVRMTVGSYSEKSIKTQYSEEYKTVVTTAKCKPYLLNCTSVQYEGKTYEVPWFILGFADGMEGDVIIEIKHRQKKFLGVPKYEIPQIMAYMILYGKSQVKLVESYKDQIRVHAITKTPEEIEEFRLRLVKLTEELTSNIYDILNPGEELEF